jgi:hypothetical protein
MARFSEIEIKLLNKYLAKTRYYSSLALIREAMEDIWEVDAPRIVRGFTDHGEKHCERLVNLANILLKSNDGKILSQQEIYLLFAGIYLHDIGMQCDVVKFPEIKARAEELGAKFDIEFTSEAAYYRIDEQKAIRNNHNFLSAAWIDYAYNSGKTVMQLAAKTIPKFQVDDLMDVCMFHSKLPINNCSNTCTTLLGRKKMIAALLRFSDELDIDSKRVNIETVKNFSLSPQNSVFWWLHNSTEIEIINKNVVHIIIRLHPQDVKEHGSFIKKVFIQEFQSKNLPVLRELEMENICIKFSENSNLVEHERSEQLPYEIIEQLQKMERVNPLEELTKKVYLCLQTLQYKVNEPNKLDSRTEDILAVIESGIFKQRVLVRCIGDEITEADVRTLNGVLDRKIPQGWLIGDSSISETVYEIVKDKDDIKVFTLSEFLNQGVPFHNYKGVA